jgi:methyltransferase of ATP-grasp peptide maturase system
VARSRDRRAVDGLSSRCSDEGKAVTAPPVTDWAPGAQRLADLLAARGDVHDPAWRSAVAAVPRHVFVPAAYQQDDTGTWQPVDVTSPSGLDLVYSPTTLVTALADRGTHQESVSSSTKPDLMLRMLEALDIHDGHKVLDIGTGTGYNAAILSHRLGENLVFSVDIDPELIDSARSRLHKIGLRPTLVTADGAGGLPEHAPFDRIIVTCSVPTVPWDWAEQLCANGKILVDVKVAPEAGNLVLLHRHPDRLEGRFTTRWGSFMTMRHHNDKASAPPQPRSAHTRRRRTTIPPHPWWDHRIGWLLAQFQGLPADVHIGMHLDPDTRQPTASFLSAPDGSWATVSLTSNHGHYDVIEGGPTALWDSLERAHQVWLEHEQPEWTRLGLTVTPDRQRLWIDTPDGTSWPLPT